METEIEQEIKHDLELLFLDLTGEGVDPEIIPELVVNVAMKTWPELKKTVWINDDNGK